MKGLQVCISDLIGVLALAAIWSDKQSSIILSTLVDALVHTLSLDLAYARVMDCASGKHVEAMRFAQDHAPVARPCEIREALSGWLTGEIPSTAQLYTNPFGDGQISMAPFRIGLHAGSGLLVAGSRRKGFPTELEVLILRVAANFATISLLECQHVHEQRRAAESLDQHIREQDALAHVMQVMSMAELGSSIAHEINQPLAAIVANGDACLRWLSRDVPNLQEARASAERIVRDGNRASDIVRSISAFASTSTVHETALDINEIVRDVLRFTQGKLSEHGITLRLTLRAALPPVLGDRVQLQRVVLNLVMNGIEAMVAVTNRPRELLISSACDSSGLVRVAVRDTGPGMHPSDLERPFDPFYSTKLEGIGLGLPISRRIIEAHAGRLWAVRNKGAGMTFLFTLPTAITSESASRSSA